MSRTMNDVIRAAISEFCRRWNLRELSIFGSAVRDDMRADSDIDVLIELPTNNFPDIDDWEMMKRELAKLLGRRVDLVSKRGIENPFVRHQIMTNREILYAA